MRFTTTVCVALSLLYTTIAHSGGDRPQDLYARDFDQLDPEGVYARGPDAERLHYREANMERFRDRTLVAKRMGNHALEARAPPRPVRGCPDHGMQGPVWFAGWNSYTCGVTWLAANGRQVTCGKYCP
ncbi:hypothetical protein MMC19_002971 [Ptychographa xylographoides]|nr:hypothetical protein [Ptychographa xylographoides]